MLLLAPFAHSPSLILIYLKLPFFYFRVKLLLAKPVSSSNSGEEKSTCTQNLFNPSKHPTQTDTISIDFLS